MSSLMPKPFHCSDCGKEFSKEKKLISHFKVHSTDKSYKCEVCKITLSQKSLYKKHIKTHFERGSSYQCPKCGKTFIRNSLLKKHIGLQCNETKQHEEKFICKECGRMYDSLTGVRSHLLKGKHMYPLFTCHSCMWICSSSKNLFIHILQHSNADVIIVGLTQAKRLEYFSTSKIRSKVAIYNPKLQESSTEDQQSKEATGSKESLEVCNREGVLQIVNKPSAIMMLASEDTAQSNITGCQEDLIILDGDIGEYHSIPSTEIIEEIVNDKILEQSADATKPSKEMHDISPTVQKECVESICHNEKKDLERVKEQNEIAFIEENMASGSLPAFEKALQSEDMMNRKMPKLVSLYPEEETLINGSTCITANNSHLMPGEMPLTIPHKLLSNRLSPETSTIIPNEVVIPYATPLPNTMFLPPLFLVQNNLPVNQGLLQNNHFQMGDTILENTPLLDQTASMRRIDDMRNMTNKMILPRKRKKRQSRAGKRSAEWVRQLTKETSGEMPLQKSQKNTKGMASKDTAVKDDGQLALSDAHSSSQPTDSKLENVSKIDSRNEDLEQQGTVTHKRTTNEKTVNLFMNQNINQYSSTDTRKRKATESNLWDTLMGSDDRNKHTIHSSSIGNTDQLHLHNKVQNSNHLSDLKNAYVTNPLEKNRENTLPKAIDNAYARPQQQSPTGGIDVEEYIKKFMWF